MSEHTKIDLSMNQANFKYLRKIKKQVLNDRETVFKFKLTDELKNTKNTCILLQSVPLSPPCI